MRVSVLGLMAAVLIALVAAPSAGAAAKVPCVPGESGAKCKVWEAKVKYVADGDTLRPYVKKSNGKWGDKLNVRVIGIQAPELKSYTHASRKGNCLGVEAAEKLDKLIKGEFRLVALFASSEGSGKTKRARRALQVKQGGKWIDPAIELLEAGLVLPFPNGKEWPWNGAYVRAAEEAKLAGRGLWNPEACGDKGPSPQATEDNLIMKVKWDAEGFDKPWGEWVRIVNTGTTAVPLKGWTLRDSHLRDDGVATKMKSGYNFPANAVIPARGSIRVVVGQSRDAGKLASEPNTLYWGLNETIFDNASNDKKQIGDGAYLFDPDMEMRVGQMFPCRTTCAEKYDGDLDLDVQNWGTEDEWITVKNTSSQTVFLYQYELENQPFYYEFGIGDFLLPGEAITVFANRVHTVNVPLGRGGIRIDVNPLRRLPGLPFADSKLFGEWGHEGLLNGNDDIVVLRNEMGDPVRGACAEWGNKFTCPKV
ncbi:MAG TPA: lamin tail domain-containing protein [Thermoleophilaceae bacterium]|nr:lamin tail domain-containing protein [Thermoleophilaceae bacterium]